MSRPLLLALLCSFTLASVGCDREPAAGPTTMESASSQPTNRIDIPSTVRQNLGITFAKVETRNVARTLRVPGRFELQPTALREYRAPAGGTIELLVQQYQTVTPGTPLYRLDSSRWREMQREIADAEAAVTLAQAGVDSIDPLLAAHETHHGEIQKSIDLWNARIETLDKLSAAGGARGDEIAQARASLASARADLAETLEKEAELIARKSETAAQLDASRSRLAFLFEAAATLAGVGADDLRATTDPTGAPRWRKMSSLEVKASSAGVVETLHAISGNLLDEHAPVVTVIQPDQVRFRAVGLQSDLSRLTTGRPATVIPAQATASFEPFGGTLTLAPTADAERRTVDLILLPTPGTTAPVWAKAGVAAFLEIVTDGSGSGELAIPLRSVVRDGTSSIIFRRDPANPDKAIRMEADLGLDDGRWVIIKSGVAEGNEVVLDGVYQLMVATSGSITKGGHFHPDGTFHEGDH
ncbi:MAG: hypothetical protein HEQ23_06795 [Tepidisphaera sp.]